MTRRVVTMAWGLAVVLIATAACGRGDTAKMTELLRVRSGAVDVVLSSPHDALHQGKDSFTIEFHSTGDGKLVDVGTVRASASMPMAGTPMLGSIDVQRSPVPGRYAANSDFGMAGTWRMTLKWDGPAGQGSVSFAGSVQ